MRAWERSLKVVIQAVSKSVILSNERGYLDGNTGDIYASRGLVRGLEIQDIQARRAQASSGGLNRVITIVIALVASGLQADYHGPNGPEWWQL